MIVARRSSSLRQQRQGWLEWESVQNPWSWRTRSFEKQGDASAFFKAMLNRYRPGERVATTRGRPGEATKQSFCERDGLLERGLD